MICKLEMHIPVIPAGKITKEDIHAEDILSDESDSSHFFEIMEIMKSSPLIFVGHNHRNSIRDYHYAEDEKIIQVMTAAFGYDASSWRSVSLTEDKILISYPGNEITEYQIKVKK